MEWSIERTTRFDNRFKKLAKKHRNECQNALDNLNVNWQGLCEGGQPAQQSVFGCVHNEGEGAYALDETGKLKTSASIRLYIFPDEEAFVLHVLTVGDKSSQSRDVNWVHQEVRAIKAGLGGTEDDQETNS